MLPGRAVDRAREREGFSRHRHHCNWTAGPAGPADRALRPAAAERGGVRRASCAATLTASTRSPGTRSLAALRADPAEHVTALEAQLRDDERERSRRLRHGGRLIAGGDLDTVLARMTERAATAVRAPRYLLAVRVAGRVDPPLPPQWVRRQRGARARGGPAHHPRRRAAHLMARGRRELPPARLRAAGARWPTTSSSSPRSASSGTLYARYAASALDGATALADAERRHDEARALLELARALAAAGTSDEVAVRLAEAVPAVVDCDRVGVFLWNEERQELAFSASVGRGRRVQRDMSELVIRPSRHPGAGGLLAEVREPSAHLPRAGLGRPLRAAHPRSASPRWR